MDCFSPGGILWLTHAVINGEIEVTPELGDILFSCTMCGNCADKCPYEFHEEIPRMIVAAREYLINEQRIPVNVRNFLTNYINKGYHWPAAGDAAAAPGTEFCSSDDWLLFLGDMLHYSDYARDTAYKLTTLMGRSGIRHGVLKNEANPDGNDIYFMGETDLFSYYAQENLEQFSVLGVKKICTYSPHSYHAFRTLYPTGTDAFQIAHYTDLLLDAWNAGDLDLNPVPPVCVSYHDPCFLTRWGDHSESARQLLKAIPGVSFREMDFSGKDALCCGGGGGNIYSDILGSGKGSPGRRRVLEAEAIGVDILAVSCPTCAAMLQDAVTDEGLQNKLQIRDVADLLFDSATPQKI